VIRCTCGGEVLVANLAAFEAVGESGRQEHIIESDVGVPRGKGESFIIRMKNSIAIQVAGIEHYLNCFPSNIAAAQPYERAQPERQEAHVEQFARSKGVEVT